MATVLERPRWAPRARAIDLTGIPEVQLLKLVNAHSVRAKTVGSGSQADSVSVVRVSASNTSACGAQ